MSNTCEARWNETAGRWEATYQGRVLASNRDRITGPMYLKNVIEGGASVKAKNLGVTRVVIIGQDTAAAPEHVEAPVVTVETEFHINERFEIMTAYVEMVAERQLASTVITGEGGLGKSFTVLRTLHKCGMKDISKLDIGDRIYSNNPSEYVVVKGYSTAKGLFRTLYENRNRIVVFDDCDSILKDPNAVNILKAALDSYDVRMVSWNAEGWGSDDDLPKSFEFEGGVIFISNLPKAKVPQAIRSRAMCADVSMSREEVVERMRTIAASDEFMPEFEQQHKEEALEFIASNAHNPMIQQLNLRSLVNAVKARASKPNNWQRLALYTIANA